MFKQRPKFKKGYAIVMHLDPLNVEPIEFPATATKPARIKWCHRVLGWSYRKCEPHDHLSFETTSSLLNKLTKEIKNAKEKA